MVVILIVADLTWIKLKELKVLGLQGLGEFLGLRVSVFLGVRVLGI